MTKALLNIVLLIIGIILWAIFAIEVAKSNKVPPCDGDCNHCPFPKCHDEGRKHK